MPDTGQSAVTGVDAVLGASAPDALGDVNVLAVDAVKILAVQFGQAWVGQSAAVVV
jgi:hypothetical protein